jgi:hypothetical protein
MSRWFRFLACLSNFFVWRLRSRQTRWLDRHFYGLSQLSPVSPSRGRRGDDEGTQKLISTTTLDAVSE